MQMWRMAFTRVYLHLPPAFMLAACPPALPRGRQSTANGHRIGDNVLDRYFAFEEYSSEP